jgi:hypothetical protein
MDDVLSLWTVFNSPTDFPGRVVARRFAVVRGKLEPVATADVIVGSSIAEVRACLPPGLYCQPRQPGDEPHIVETWF